MNRLFDTLRSRWRFAMLAGLVLLCVAFGGSSRADNISLLVVRPACVCFIVFALVSPGSRDWAGLRGPMLLLGAFAATMVIQLVPLPPMLWTMLPGHARFVEVAAMTGVTQPWRPTSVAPDMTFNSLLALLVPLAVLIGASTVPLQQRSGLIPVLLIAIVASAVLGIMQWAGSSSSPLYFYRYTNRDLPVGFFANRNHQAVFLAMALPLLRAWALLPSSLVADARKRTWIAAAAALLIFPVILATGSRSGLVLAMLGAGASLLFASPRSQSGGSANARAGATSRKRPVMAAAAATVVIVVGATIVFGRALSITRLGQVSQVESDLRVRYLPIIVDIARDHMPWGSGYGTFDPMFRIYEPFWALKPTYFNHAHNDLLELAMTGGIPAVLVALALLGLMVTRIRGIWVWGRRRSASLVAGSGTILVLLALAASLTDYPLRTPALAMVFALASLWMTVPLTELRRSAPAPGRHGT